MLSSVEAHYKDPSNPYPGDDNAVIYELTPYVESAGIHDPLTKVIILCISVSKAIMICYQIYVTLKPVKGLTYIIFIFILTQLTKLVYNKSIGKQ